MRKLLAYVNSFNGIDFRISWPQRGSGILTQGVVGDKTLYRIIGIELMKNNIIIPLSSSTHNKVNLKGFSIIIRYSSSHYFPARLEHN